MREFKVCLECGKDISHQPDHHDVCYKCWKEVYSKRVSKYILIEKTKIDYKQSNNDIDKCSLKDALDNDKYAYYNLYGKFPKQNDW